MSSVVIFLLCLVAIFIGMDAILLDEVTRLREENGKLREIIRICGEVLRNGNKDE